MGSSGSAQWEKLVYIPYSCPLPGQSDVIGQILYNPPVFYASHHLLQPREAELFTFVLTERRLHRDGSGLLRLLAQSKDIDSLDAKHVALTWDQAVDNKPETNRVLSLVLDLGIAIKLNLIPKSPDVLR